MWDEAGWTAGSCSSGEEEPGILVLRDEGLEVWHLGSLGEKGTEDLDLQMGRAGNPDSWVPRRREVWRLGFLGLMEEGLGLRPLRRLGEG